MGKRYFCDYCQRSFIDDIDSRKKHLNSVLHLRLKKEYYFLNRDLKTLIKEEREKEVCRRFRNTGDCPFGYSCMRTHYTEEELASFEETVRQKEEQVKDLPSIFNEFVAEFLHKNQYPESTIPPLGGNINFLDPSLPPSLRPPTIEQLTAAKFSEWG